MQPLPVDDALADVLAAVGRRGAVVLVAPPGSGKTTRVPPALLDVVPGKVLVLEPRRVAARAAATRIAEERGWTIGEEVGWRVRFEDCTSPGTRLVALTEGLLTRWLQDDPFLDGVGAVVLDEVHERSVHTDLAVALLADLRREARPDLVVVAMSATLEPGRLALVLGADVVRAEGRAFPVDVTYDDAPDVRPLALRVKDALRDAPPTGDALVFLSGVGPIRWCADALADGPFEVVTLHGQLSVDEQARALRPGSRRRVVLATNVAETSVTLPGVTYVIDSGLAKVNRLDVALGVERLGEERISAASADQRAGRAGRVAPGRCRRLWTRAEALRPSLEPELSRVDLAPLVLDVRAWGTSVDALPWWDVPPVSGVRRAEDLLRTLGALDAHGLTPIGRSMAKIPVHPRLSRMLVEGHRRGCVYTAAGAAALASERDPFPDGVAGADRPDDLWARLGRLDRARDVARVRDALARAARSALGPSRETPANPDDLVACLLVGFPDRLGRRVGPRTWRFGFGAAEPDRQSLLEDPDLVLAVDVVGAPKGATAATHRIRLGCPVEAASLPTVEVVTTAFDAKSGAVVQRVEHRFGDVVVRVVTRPARDEALLRANARASDVRRDEATESLFARVRFLRRHLPELELPDPTPERLLDLACEGHRTLAEVRAVDVAERYLGALDWTQRQALDAEAPERLSLPGGRAHLRYDDGAVVLSAKVQALFGVEASPRVALGRVPVTIELLSPAMRPVQVTQDLAGFWRGSYKDVRKDLRGRYPKHAWPEDPWNPQPTRR